MPWIPTAGVSSPAPWRTRAANEGLNIHAYDYHATDVATPLLDPVANSIGGDNQVVYVGVNGLNWPRASRTSASTTTSRTRASPAPASYRVHYADQSATLLPANINGPYTMPAGELVDAYRVPERRVPRTTSSSTSCPAIGGPGCGLLRPRPVLHRDGQCRSLTLNTNGGGLDESGSLTATVTGFYGVAVYKTAPRT
jgi:hypothetical protein